MSRRASLPGAEELFRRTTEKTPQVNKSTKLQVAEAEDTASATSAPAKGPRHQEKITIYCTSEDLVTLERARLDLRAGHGVGADRGKIVRTALAYVLEDFEARGEDSILIRRLTS